MEDKDDESIELLTEQEICELHEAFNIFDIDSDGTIPISQLVIFMNALNQYPEKLEEIKKSIDKENKGQINFNQFLKIMAKRIKNVNNDEEKKLKNLFISLDRNKNGLISLHEIKYIVMHSEEKFSDKDIETLMKEADTDGDGLISFEEFMTIMKN